MAKVDFFRNLDYNSSKGIGFCETCIGGKHHYTKSDSSQTQSKELLELFNSDVCGKMSEKSIGGAQYFLTLTNDKSRYSWVYIHLKHQALVDRKKVKTLRTDNGGEYTSSEFESYMKKFGMEECKPVSTPVDVSSKLMCAIDDDDCTEERRYQSAPHVLISQYKTRHILHCQLSSLILIKTRKGLDIQLHAQNKGCILTCG